MHIQPDCPYRCLERIERKATIVAISRRRPLGRDFSEVRAQGALLQVRANDRLDDDIGDGVLKVHSLTVSVLLDCDKQNLTSKLAESCSAQEALHAE
jgi:hypothetical protein